MRACIDFHYNIPRTNRDLFLTVLNRMSEAFSRYYTQDFIDLVADYVYQYGVIWYTEQSQKNEQFFFPGWDSLPTELWNRAFDAAFEEFDGGLFDDKDGE